MLIEVLAATFELVAGEPDADEIDSHGELLVLGLYLAVAGVLLRQRLVVHRQSEHDVGPYLSGVERAVKAAQLHRVIAVEEAVQIEKVVAAVVVVRIAGSTILAVPNLLHLRERPGLFLVQLSHHIGVHLLAVIHPIRRNLESLVEQVVAGSNEVHKVPQAPGRMVVAVQMDVDAAGVVSKPSGLFEPPDKPLERSDILTIGKDRADQLHAVATTGIDGPAALFLLAVDTAIGHELPNASIRGGDLIGAVVPAGHP